MTEPIELGPPPSVSPGSSEGDDAATTHSPPTGTELRQDLKERHVNMIAFSVCVGMGLFLQCGKVIFLVGPALAWVVYLLSGLIIFCAVASLGEMSALFPVKGGLFVFPRRFLDAGVGYAAGWMTWFSSVVIIASEVLAVAQLFTRFQFDPQYLQNVKYPDANLSWELGQNPAIWAASFLVIILVVNCLPVLWYGRLEYVIGIIKMIFIVGLIFFNVVINVLQRVPHPPYGRVWTWNYPFSAIPKGIALRNNPDKVLSGGGGVFLAFWSSMTTVVFSIIGFETISITAPENKELKLTETVKMGTRKIALRVILLYTLSAIVVSFNVPYSEENLKDLSIHSIASGRSSVFILAAVLNGVGGWPHFFNGFFIFSATSAGINWLYLSSRILHALAGIEEVWPNYAVVSSIRTRLERTHLGVPYNAILISWLFGLLGFLATGRQPSIELGRMAVHSSVSMLIVYAVVCLSYIEFYNCIDRATRGQTQDMQIPPGQDPNAYNRKSSQYPYRSRGQWLKAYVGLGSCSLLVLFNGWRSFITPFSARDFIASYISLVIFATIASAYHVSLDGWNPRGWKRRTNFDLQHPPPMVVELMTPEGKLKKRAGRLGEVDIYNVFSKRNARTLGSWIWAWLK